ncbi:hypothetical protein NONO_c22340 [Nocardia nova SH22a]|uniref:Uncharacterized protein n=1 Tax=Nocardia nova SH22a TaxID=1415166 RepID=W5TCQ1_9NOCA|nr:hypothetical protein [Nocardia nova]AHH17032.1 hypothetical protein NONO_c22340 [Nocardia nova SH22a]
MLGFAIVDRQSDAGATVVWETGRIDSTIVRNTDAGAIGHDDPGHDSEVRRLVADRPTVSSGARK